MESNSRDRADDLLTYILASLRDLGISVADTSTLVRMINDGQRSHAAADDIVEMAFARLCSKQIEVLVDHDNEHFSGDLLECFSSAGKRLLSETGVVLPAFTLTPSPSVQGLVIKWNNSQEPLAPVNPFDEESIYNILHSLASQFLTIEEVEWRLAQLSTNNPIVAQEVLMHFSIGDVTRVLRGLVGRGRSILNLPGILEQLLPCDTIPIDSNSYMVFDDRLAVAPEAPSASAWQKALAFLCRKPPIA